MAFKKISIRRVSFFSIIVVLVVGLLCGVVYLFSSQQFVAMEQASEKYIRCEDAVDKIENASKYLTQQSRMAANTGEITYVNNFFNEVNVDRNREKGLTQLEADFKGSDVVETIQTAIDHSNELCITEYYAMRLTLEAYGVDRSLWPNELSAIELSTEDAQLSSDDMRKRAVTLLSDDAYEQTRSEILNSVEHSGELLLQKTQGAQSRAKSMFVDSYRKLALCITVFILAALGICIMVRRLVVKPLLMYNESIRLGEIFPVVGAAELQNLAETYNAVFRENTERQQLIRHQAEHDALTDLLNRGSFDKLLDMYEADGSSFALIIVDVDIFKSVNDTYGHEMGDAILKRVSGLLKTAFRSIDHVCRIGGDEFAVIMVEMTSDLAYTIEGKVADMNAALAKPEGDMPAVSLSVGVAFADRLNPGESIFTDADKALYHTKRNGRCGCTIYDAEVAAAEAPEGSERA